MRKRRQLVINTLVPRSGRFVALTILLATGTALSGCTREAADETLDKVTFSTTLRWAPEMG